MTRAVILLCAGALALHAADAAADVVAGAKTFRSHCAQCHGVNATGGRGPNLASGVFYRGGTDEDLMRNISQGIPGTEMPALFYSEDRIRQIVAYLRSLSASGGAAATGDSARGKALYLSSGCANCHRIAGEGGRLGPDLTNVGRSRSPNYLRITIMDPANEAHPRSLVVSFVQPDGKSYSGLLMNEDTYSVQFLDSQEQLRSISKAGLRNYKVERLARMPSFKDKLSNEQLEDLVAYLAALRPTGGTQ